MSKKAEWRGYGVGEVGDSPVSTIIEDVASTLSPRKRILVLCTGNSARSQMTEGFLKSLDPQLEVHSAGTQPAARVNPYAVRAMQEIGIDIASEKPKNVSQFLGQWFDFVITVCGEADKSCPAFRGKVGERLHMDFPDPAQATGSDEEKMNVFRVVRDDIQKRFRAFYEDKVAARP
jgi:arsenate reductase (thioredoxin)